MLKFIHTIVVCGIVGVVAYFGHEFYAKYMETTGTMFERAVQAAKGSATVLWARFVTLVGALSIVVVSGAELVGAPGVADSVKQYLQPQYVAAFMIAISLISEMARRRTLPKD